MRGAQNMASDSEHRKFVSRPLRSHILGSKKPVRLLMSDDSAGVEVGQQQQWQLQNYIEHNTHRLFWRHLSRFSSACVDDEATRMHTWQTVFCQPSSIYLSLTELLLWTADLTDWVKLECLYRTGWHTVWRTLRKTLTMIFSVVSYIMKIMFYIRC